MLAMFAWIFGSIFAVVFFGGIGYMVWSAESRVMERRLRTATPLQIGDIREGQYVRVIGRAQCDEPLQAPYTHRPCVAYNAFVVEKKTSRNGTTWPELALENKSIDFRIEDESGSIRVVVKDAYTFISQDVSTERKDFKKKYRNANEDILRLLRENAPTAKGTYYGWEGVLEIGEVLALCGTAALETDPDAPEGSPKILVLRNDADKTMVISDRDRFVSGEMRAHRRGLG